MCIYVYICILVGSKQPGNSLQITPSETFLRKFIFIIGYLN